MLTLKLAVLVVLILQDQVHAGRIVGGHEVVAHSRPYMVLLERHTEGQNMMFCGGFLLSEDFVMTAAHCQADTYKVFLGVHKKEDRNNSEVQKVTVEQYYPHEEYNKSTYRNDLMILKLSPKAKLTKNVKSIDLTDSDDGSLPTSCSVSGWGQIDWKEAYMTQKLQETTVTLFENENCTKKNVYCSQDAEGPGVGDSGGPLVCEGGKAYGVVSIMYLPKNQSRRLFMYTKIPDYKSWIQSIIKKALIKS